MNKPGVFNKDQTNMKPKFQTPANAYFRSTPTKDEVEGYKQWWKEHPFPDVDPVPDTRMGVGQGNNPTWQTTPEAALWVALINESIDDYLKAGSHWKHTPCDCKEHVNNHECAKAWFAGTHFEEIATALGIDPSYFRRTVATMTPKARPGRKNGTWYGKKLRAA